LLTTNDFCDGKWADENPENEKPEKKNPEYQKG
jgi:hypothetical protein